ncbi:hypothetical protein RRM46_000269 [Flavobacterium psychrophilum]|nr:hypothetical protein [Flavobacterium psychrophilum]
MSLKHNEIEIIPKNPFQNCILERQKYSEILTNIINSYSEGFVLAINNKWGTGKTTFVKMWEQDLKNKNFQTVYFNAWENDFENNALTALMGELKTITNSSTEPEFKSILKKVATLSKHIAPIVAKAIADKYIDTQGIKDAIVDTTKGFTDIFENDVNEYAEKKKGIKEFRKSLSHFITNTNEGKPLIFIIDELDRCRPDYSVSILEQIKHFFSVSNIVFILSIDKIQLGNAVRGVYGSEKMDTDEYLRRFIDIEYSIPEPEPNVFHKYLYAFFNFDEFFNSPERKKYHELNSDRGDFIIVCNVLFGNSSISLRQQEKIFSNARLSLRSFQQNSYLIPIVFLFLNYIKIMDYEFFNDLKLKKLTIVQLQQKLLSIVTLNNDEDYEKHLMWLEAYLTYYYNNYLNSRYNRNKLYKRNEITNKNEILINSVINPTKNEDLLRIFENIERTYNAANLDLGYFINKIELLETISN